MITLLFLAASFSDRMGAVDEIGLFNPAYMDAHYGKISYPIYGYFNEMVVHPPVHYKFVGGLMRLGLTYYYAESIPPLVWLLVGVLLIIWGPFSGPVKMGLLFGLGAPIAVFAHVDLEQFGMRPEGELNAAWLAGLIALESGRLADWDVKRLFAGAFLLTYASGLHYYAVPALLGVAIYAVWVVSQLGWRRARKALLAVAAGGLLFGVPYLLLFIVPEWPKIMDLVHAVPRESIWQIVQTHRAQYRVWAAGGIGPPWLLPVFKLGVPVLLLSTPILLVFSATRGIALASLPLQVFVLMFAGHKHAYYYLHEVALYSAALVVGVVSVADRFLAKLPWRYPPKWVILDGIAAILGVSLVLGKWDAKQSEIVPGRRVQEAEIARAAGKEMLGPNASVGGRMGVWYACGAANWYSISSDLLWHALPSDFDVAKYASRFDALAEHSHMSDATSNDKHATLSSWYLDSALQLRGFFFAETNTELSYLLLGGKRQQSISGYALKHHQLYRFQEAAGGPYELVSIVCPQVRDAIVYSYQVPFGSLLYLPHTVPAESGSVLITALLPSDRPRSYASIHPACREVNEIRGSLFLTDINVMVDKLRGEDRPMQFYQRLEDVPGATQRSSNAAR